jgi:hypothetical protein
MLPYMLKEVLQEEGNDIDQNLRARGMKLAAESCFQV